MKKLGRWAFGLCAGVFVAGFVADYLASSPPDLTSYAVARAPLAGTILSVVLFGCLGAYLSIQQRLLDSSDGGDPVIGILGLHEFSSTQPFPLVAGGLFAIVMYFLIAAGFMQGDLFPDLNTAQEARTGVPANLNEWAKLFIWAFLAGFAERLVPDTLNPLVNRARPRAGDAAVLVQHSARSGGGAETGRPASGRKPADEKHSEPEQAAAESEPKESEIPEPAQPGEKRVEPDALAAPEPKPAPAASSGTTIDKQDETRKAADSDAKPTHTLLDAVKPLEGPARAVAKIKETPAP
jgi:hypothetical protein